jgi:hypothetical protein
MKKAKYNNKKKIDFEEMQRKAEEMNRWAIDDYLKKMAKERNKKNNGN